MPFSLNKNVSTFNQSGTHYQRCLHLPKPWPSVYDFSFGGKHLQVIKRMLQNNSNDPNQLGIDGQKLQGSPIISWYLQALTRPSQSAKRTEEDIVATPI